MPRVYEGEITIGLPEISKILLVLRNDADYKKAVENAISIASGRNSRVYVLYAVDMELPPIVPEDIEREVYNRLREEGKKIVDDAVRRLKAAGIEVEEVGMHFGFAAERILRVEKQLKPDLIILSTRGLSTLKKILMGSVSEEVTKEAKAPVLLVK